MSRHHHQFDMFAVLTPAPVHVLGPIPLEIQREFDDEDAAARFSFIGSKADWSDEEKAAWDGQWDRHKREYARGQGAEDAGMIEVLGWGAGTPGKEMRFGKPGYTLRLWNDFGRWRIKEDLNLHNSGSAGPYQGPFESRVEAMLHAFRRIIGNAARAAAVGTAWEDESKRGKQLAQLARWCCDQLPPLLSGVDLAEELEAQTVKFSERESLRRKAIVASQQTYVGEDGRERSIYSL